jgi:hypothetical protein
MIADEKKVKDWLFSHEENKPSDEEKEYWKGYWEGVRWAYGKVMGENIKPIFKPPED